MTYLFLLASQVYSAVQAATMLDRLEGLRVGGPEADFYRAVTPCKVARDDQKVDYVLIAGGFRFESLWELFWKLPDRWPYKGEDILNRAGLRYWRIQGSAYLREGRIERLSTSLYLVGRYETLGTGWKLADRIRPRYEGDILAGGNQKTYMGWYHITSRPSGEGFQFYVTPESQQNELQARRINRKCFFSFRGCDGLCELLPDAARLLEERQGSFGGCTSVPRSWCELKHDDCRSRLEGYGPR